MSILDSHIESAQQLYKGLHTAEFSEAFDRADKAIIKALQAGKTILVAGNGGSAGEAQHFTAELVGRYKTERRGLPAIALTVDTSALTAVGNDYSFDDVFARQIEALGREGDVFVAMSTSGNSPNILRALEKAREHKLVTIALGGKGGGKMKDACDIPLIVTSDDTPRIQEAHLLLIHALSESVDEHFS